MASMIESETFEQTVQRKGRDRMHKARMRLHNINNHNILHCVNIRPKCLAVRTDSRTVTNELISKGMPYQLESKHHDIIVHETVIGSS